MSKRILFSSLFIFLFSIDCFASPITETAISPAVGSITDIISIISLIGVISLLIIQIYLIRIIGKINTRINRLPALSENNDYRSVCLNSKGFMPKTFDLFDETIANFFKYPELVKKFYEENKIDNS